MLYMLKCLTQQLKKEKTYFMDKKNKKKICIECGEETTNHYPLPTNRGKIHRCARCHENWVRKSTRMENSKAPQKE
jgi:formylmethanofuran dehydrogenase subunit E